MLRPGRAELQAASGRREARGAGHHFGGLALSAHAGHGAMVRLVEPAQGYRLPLEPLAHTPVVRRKLIETQRRRYAGR